MCVYIYIYIYTYYIIYEAPSPAPSYALLGHFETTSSATQTT